MEKCSFKTSAIGPMASSGIERQCLLNEDHVKDMDYFGPGSPKAKKRPHEIAPICEHCGSVMESTPGNPKNEKFKL